MPDKFKCPKCGSGRTKPVAMAIAGGTRRRQTVGFSRRSLWSSRSTYKSDLVASLPTRPSNSTAYFCIALGVCGLFFVLLTGHDAGGVAVLVGIVSVILLLIGFGAKKSPERLSDEQSDWDNRWLCARCGYQWEG